MRTLAGTPDLFDILDVSLREDTYTSLIAHVLGSDGQLARRVFGELTREAGFRPDHVDIHFRRQAASLCTAATVAGKKDKPDLVLIGTRGTERWWVVIEAKVTAGEGPSQLRRYQQICEQERNAGGIAGYTLYFLTLAGHTPSEPSYRAITHAELATLFETTAGSGFHGRSHFAAAWSAYRKRLEQFTNAVPDPDSPVLQWLSSAPVGFVTADERCRRLASIVVPDGWESSGGHFVAKGHANALVLAWRPSWIGSDYDPGGPHRLAECFNIHFEAEIATFPETRDTATCHLHYETRPYLPTSQLSAVATPDEIAEFTERRERFRAQLHARLAGLPDSGWQPRPHKLQIARFLLPTPPGMTIAELRERLETPLDQIATVVDDLQLRRRP